MLIPHEFKLPATKTCLVIWYRNDKRHEQVINTPTTCKGLQQIMFARYQVGYSEIRAVEADPDGVLTDVSSINLNSLFSGTNHWGLA